MVFEAKGLVKSYRKRCVVKGVDLSVEIGETVGLLGPNGAGKTTIFNMMVGLITPDQGEILLMGEEITRLPMYLRSRQGVSYLPQEASIFRKLTVRENLLAIAQTLSLSSEECNQRIENLLEALGLSHLAHHKAYTLSGGERRRAEISRALITKPKFILLDEPFAGIDPIAVEDIQKIIDRLRHQGIGILITDHNVQETLQITDRAYIINEGEILELGTPDQIAQSPKARAIYLGEGFTLNKREKAYG